MQIVEYKITDVKPATYNPRTITDQELSGLMESLKKFGFVDPLIVNKRTNILVGGHQRLKAAEMLGLDKVPVVEVDLNEIEEKALNVSLNSHAIQGKFDEEILSVLLKEVKLELPEYGALELESLEFKLPEVKEIEPTEKPEREFKECPHCGCPL
jgi:ParB-like chromosome segregation protein Spo0J